MREDKKVGVASDHAGYEMKEFIVGYLDAMGYEVLDFGCHSPEPCDYPDYAHPLAEAIEQDELTRGISFCGSGNGIAMALNKHQKIRAALCWNTEISRLARAHNDANVCSIPARFVSNTEASGIIDVFLNTPFDGGRHQARIDKIPLPECRKGE